MNQEALELETERLRMRPITQDDYALVHKLQTHPEVMRYIGMGHPKSEIEAQELFHRMHRHQQKHGFSLCPTYEKNSGSFIGFSGLVHLELKDDNPDIEVGYWLLPEYWGNGYATEAATACVNWAFQNLPIDSLVGITHPDNQRSQNVLKKAGLVCIGPSTYRGQNVLRFEIKRTVAL